MIEMPAVEETRAWAVVAIGIHGHKEAPGVYVADDLRGLKLRLDLNDADADALIFDATAAAFSRSIGCAAYGSKPSSRGDGEPAQIVRRFAGVTAGAWSGPRIERPAHAAA